MRKLVLLFALFVLVAVAADVTGTWKAEMKTPDGQTRTSTFVFKADGDKLTGTVQGMRGDPAPIQNGKIKGDTLSFSVTRRMGDQDRKMDYKGTVSGDEMKLKTSFGDREFEMTARKQ
jgi:hypothetical protein